MRLPSPILSPIKNIKKNSTAHRGVDLKVKDTTL